MLRHFDGKYPVRKSPESRCIYSVHVYKNYKE